MCVIILKTIIDPKKPTKNYEHLDFRLRLRQLWKNPHSAAD